MPRETENGKVTIGNTQMCYARFGHGKNALVVLPGLSDGLAAVQGKALLLAGPYKPVFGQYTVYMFSRKNDMPQGYSIWDMAEDQSVALRQLGIEKAAVLGVSQGGMIALALAAGHPETVEKLVLAVTAPGANPLIRERVARWVALAEAGDHRGLMADTAEHSYSPARLKTLRRFYPVLGAVGKPTEYRRFLINARAILAFNAADRLPYITCPTLVIGGAEDDIVGAEASRQLHGQLPNSELYIYPGLGHAAYEEAKDFYPRVFRFLQQPAQNGSAAP